MMYQMHTATDEEGVDWYAYDTRQPALLPARPLLAAMKERK